MDGITIGKPEELGLSSARLGRIDGWMRNWVDSGRFAGMQVMVARHGKVAWHNAYGLADVARNTPMRDDTIVRIYSMTKPLTSTAIMMLYEEGRFQLDDPITRFLPAFRDMRVLVSASRGRMETLPAERDITFRDLLTHTAGLTYSFLQSTPVDALYTERGLDFQTSEKTLAELVEGVAQLPLLAQPGTRWNYSVATDVLGHLVAVVSGQDFATFMQDRVLAPLGMTDTAFHVPADKLTRFAANYAATPEGGLQLFDDSLTSTLFTAPRPIASGGGGLVSTIGDYMKFCQMMLRKGVAADGTRLLGRKTVELMTANHLSGDVASMGPKRFSETTTEGIGFGLGFSVMLNPARAQILGTQGEFAWSGAASTSFWIDPVEDMAVIQLAQLVPGNTYPIRRELRVLTYQAIVD